MRNRATRIDPMARVAEPAAIMNRLGLTAPMLAKIGTIAVLAGKIEHETAVTIRALGGHDPLGQGHCMGGGSISDRIRALAEVSSSLQSGNFKSVVVMWCQAAEPAFTCRNSIFHSLTCGGHGAWASFLENPQGHTEIRKRKASEFHAGEHTLALIERVFAVLYRVLVTIAGIVRDRSMEIGENSARALSSALRKARSVSCGLEDLVAAANCEKD